MMDAEISPKIGIRTDKNRIDQGCEAPKRWLSSRTYKLVKSILHGVCEIVYIIYDIVSLSMYNIHIYSMVFINQQNWGLAAPSVHHSAAPAQRVRINGRLLHGDFTSARLGFCSKTITRTPQHRPGCFSKNSGGSGGFFQCALCETNPRIN